MQRLGSMSAPGTSVLAPCVMLVHSDSLDCFCFGSECCQSCSPTQLRAYLLQRPWDRCELLPAAVGTEHFWHMHSFPLKVTRSPGGKGSLK